MVGRLGIGNGIGIPFRNKVSGEGAYLSPDLKEALVGVWIADQNTNESPTRNIIKNKLSDRGGDFEILNAAYKLNSGYGKYEEDFTRFRSPFGVLATVKHDVYNIKGTVSGGWLFYVTNTNKTNQTKVSISGLKDSYYLLYDYHQNDGHLRLEIREDGVYDIPANDGLGDGRGSGFLLVGINGDINVDITIKQIPSYQAAFVTDGVDDLIVSEKSVSDILGGSNEITVISMIHQIKLNNTHGKGFTNYIENINSSTSFVRTQSNVAGKTGIYGYTYNSKTQLLINNILGDKNDYEKLLANATTILSNSKFSVASGINYPNLFSQVAWYWTIIANKVLTTDEINQVIAYYNLDKYVAPDIYYDVKKQGITNENHAEFGDKLIDYSGKGKDMQLYNFGWKLDSGVGLYKLDFSKCHSNQHAAGANVIFNSNKIEFNNVTVNYINAYYPRANFRPAFTLKIKVSGLKDDGVLRVSISDTEDLSLPYVEVYEASGNGTHTIQIPNSYRIVFGLTNVEPKVTLEQVPEYKGALVTDGVEDYSQYVGDLGLKDYTVVADRAYVELMQNQVPIISNDIATTLTPFIFEYTSNIANTVNPFSFGGRNTINKPIDQNKLISYQSTYVYNGDSISKLGGTDITCTGLTFGRYGSNSQYAKLCLQSFMLFPYSLSEFLIERQLKKRKLGTLHPDMVELRPIVKINDDTLTTEYCKETGEAIFPGDYVPIGSKVLIYIRKKDSSAIIGYEVRQVLVNGKETELIYTMVGDAYGFIITKSPQKINVTIDSYVLYENMDFPYPFIPNLYWDKELKNRITWGDKVKVGSTIYGHLDTNLLPELYTHDGIIYKGQTVNRLPIVVEDYMYFEAVSKRYLKENEPKCILSPERLRLPNEVYKRIGCIPDISGHYNHGFLYNLAYTEESGATADGAIKLDGVNDYISITNLGSGGKQVLMKTLWSNAPALLYDQRYGGNLGFAILTTTKDDINNLRLAYEGRNENGYTYIDGILNKYIETYTLQGVIHNITITNDEDTDSQNPTIGKSNYNNASYANMLLYTFMLFDEISTEEEIKELNEIVGIEGNTNDLFNPTN